MNYFIILLLSVIFISGSLLATDSDEVENNLFKKEKTIKVIKPVDLRKLDKDVKNEEDAKNSISKGGGDKGGGTVIDPHNYKDVEGDKIKTQKIKDEEDSDISIIMPGLGDKEENKKDGNKDDKKVIINPYLNENPFNDKRLVENIKNKDNIKDNIKDNQKSIDIYGNLGVRVNFRDDKNNLGNTLFELQTKFDLSFEKKFTNSSFKITFGTIDTQSINNDWITTSTVESNDIPIGLKEAYYIYSNSLNIKMGRFISSFESDYFFSKYLSFDGLEFYGNIKETGIYYKLLTSILQNENTFTDTIDIAGLVTFNLGYDKNNLNIATCYSWLYGKDLNTTFLNLLNREVYSEHNHYITGHISYLLNLNKDNLLKFSLDGSYNLSADEDKFGLSLEIKHESNTFISEITLLYKQLNSVISPMALQSDFFINDVMGANFKFMYKYDEAMSSGIEFSLGKSIINTDSDISYLTRAVYNINF